MALIVKKFGGTSVGSIGRIQEVAKLALDAQAKGDQVVLVVSAMAGETNRLVDLANQINPIPNSREYDMILSSGEQISAGLVSLAINTEAKKRRPVRGEAAARPLLGHQIGIKTDSVYSKARIHGIHTELLFKEIAAGIIPVIAGFQGVDADNNITTLGRGGSDTSAVAIAIAMKADECQIFTDVEGVYTTDPRLCPKAQKIKEISYEEMMELASLGAKVLQIRSVELAAKYRLTLQVRSSITPNIEGTRVMPQDQMKPSLEQVLVAGVAADPNQVKFSLGGLKPRPGILSDIFKSLSAASIVVDIIVQDYNSPSAVSLSFTVVKSDQLKTQEILSGLVATKIPEMEIRTKEDLAKVSIVGVGMQHHPGVASRMFALLDEADITIELITTSEIKISCLVHGAKMQKAVQVLHKGFGLET